MAGENLALLLNLANLLAAQLDSGREVVPPISERLTNEEALSFRLAALYEDIANHYLDLSEARGARGWASLEARGGSYPGEEYWEREADPAFWGDPGGAATQPTLKMRP